MKEDGTTHELTPDELPGKTVFSMTDEELDKYHRDTYLEILGGENLTPNEKNRILSEIKTERDRRYEKYYSYPDKGVRVKSLPKVVLGKFTETIGTELSDKTTRLLDPYYRGPNFTGEKVEAIEQKAIDVTQGLTRDEILNSPYLTELVGAMAALENTTNIEYKTTDSVPEDVKIEFAEMNVLYKEIMRIAKLLRS